MSDFSATLNRLLRPRVLIKAARFGLKHYDRARHLPRLVSNPRAQSDSSIAHKLVDMEAELDAKRTSKDAAYSVQRHIDVLTALLAETARRGGPASAA